MINIAGGSSILLNCLPLPCRVRAGQKRSATFSQGGPISLPTARASIKQAILDKTNVGRASKDGHNNNSMDRVGTRKSGEELEQGSNPLAQPSWRLVLGHRRLAAKAFGEERSRVHGVGRFVKGDSARRFTTLAITRRGRGVSLVSRSKCRRYRGT